MDRRQLWKRVRKIWIVAGLTATIAFVAWSLVAYRASAEAHAAAQSDGDVAVQRQDGVVSFLPRAPRAVNATTALVFFPGALVNPIAYAPLLRAAAAAGYPAYLIELPRRGAFGGAEDAEIDQRLRRVLALPAAPTRWVAAGHSRGAVVATQVAADPPSGFAGLVLIGTSHPRDVDLSGMRVPVTKVVGTRDGLASRDEVQANAALLPAATRWVWIEGGNHSQFGWYGFQPGDGRATISADTQRAAMIAAVLDALSSDATVQRPACPEPDTSVAWVRVNRAFRDAPGARWTNDSLRRVLLALQEKDQKARVGFGANAGDSTYVKGLIALDSTLAIDVEHILDVHGLPSRSTVGAAGARAIMLLVQHNSRLQQRTIAMAKALPPGQVPPDAIAMMEDRILANQGRPQVYGTHFNMMPDGRFTFAPTIDLPNLEKRRAAAGIPPLSYYVCVMEEAGMRINRASLPP